MAFRAPLSQRGWESHQPQEERHSRYLPHLQATQQIPASPSRRDPASPELLGGEVLVPSHRRARRLRTGQRRAAAGRVPSCPVLSPPVPCCLVLSRPAAAAPGVPWRGEAKGGSGAARPSGCSERVPLPARTCLYQALAGRAEAEPPAAPAQAALRGRRCPDSTERPGLGAVSGRPGQRAQEQQEQQRAGAGQGRSRGHVLGEPGVRPRPGARDIAGLPSALGMLLYQPHSPGRLSQRKLFRFSASSPFLRGLRVH